MVVETTPMSEKETQEVVTALLTLGQDQMQPRQTLENLETLPPVPPDLPENFMSGEKPSTANIDTSSRPNIPIEANMITDNQEVPDTKGKIIGTAIKTLADKETPEPKTKKEKVNKKKKTEGRVTIKSYSLKRTKTE